MNSNRQELDSTRVLDSLRREGELGLDPSLESRLLQRLELSTLGLTVPVLDGLNGTEKSFYNPSLADRYSASLALHPLPTLVTTLALGGLLGAFAHAGVVSQKQSPLHRAGPSGVTPAAAVTAAASVSAVPQTQTVSIDDLPAVAPGFAKGNKQAPVHAFSSTKAAAAPALEPAIAEPGASLAEQVALLETARAALVRKDASAALLTLESHARRYPTSPLTEEREALTIKSLVLAGRVEQARAQLTQFERQFPGSLMLPALRESFGAFP